MSYNEEKDCQSLSFDNLYGAFIESIEKLFVFLTYTLCVPYLIYILATFWVR